MMPKYERHDARLETVSGFRGEERNDRNIDFVPLKQLAREGRREEDKMGMIINRF